MFVFNREKPIRRSKAVKIWDLMQDRQYHSNVELMKLVGWRFGAYIHALRKHGVVFIKGRGHLKEPTYVEYFKIRTSPKYVSEIRGNMVILREKRCPLIVNYEG